MFRFLTLTALVYLFKADLAFAQFEALTGIPGLTDQGEISIAEFINRILILAITVGGMLAVVRISISGFKYMFTDVVPTKQNARQDIIGALLGLGILLAGATILITINPNIQNLDVFRKAKSLEDLVSGEFHIGGAASVPPTKEFATSAEAEAYAEEIACPRGFELFSQKLESGKFQAGCKDVWSSQYTLDFYLPIGEPAWSGEGITRAERVQIMEDMAGIVRNVIRQCNSAPGFVGESTAVGNLDLEHTPDKLIKSTSTGSGYGLTGGLTKRIEIEVGWKVTCKLKTDDD